jgi:uncharacterized membrane protein YbaN (DUF454 family)
MKYLFTGMLLLAIISSFTCWMRLTISVITVAVAFEIMSMTLEERMSEHRRNAVKTSVTGWRSSGNICKQAKETHQPVTDK